jgi:iron complex outermembrane receptor protein
MICLRPLLVSAAVCGFVNLGPAQVAPTVRDSGPVATEAVDLDPFQVKVRSSTEGYTPTESVAATRIAVALKDLPINVQVISGDFLKDAVVLDMVDALRYKGVNANRDIRYNSTFIRGFNNRILKRNGVRRDLNWGTANVERMEIVKGPASILYGEANPGGTILYMTKKPVAQNFVRLEEQVATDDFYRTLIDAGAEVAGNRNLLVRVIAERQDSKNFYDGAYVDRWFANPTLTWRITPQLTLDLDYEYTYHKEQQVMYFFRTTRAVMDAPPITMATLPTPVPFAHAEITGLKGQVALTEFFTRAGNAPVDSHFQAQSRDTFIRLVTNWYEATANYRFDNDWVVRAKFTDENTHDDELQFGANGNNAVLNGGILGVGAWDGRQNINHRVTSFVETTGKYHLGRFLNTAIGGYEYRRDNLNAPVFVPPPALKSPVTGLALPVRGNLAVLPIVEIPLVRFRDVPGAGQFTPRRSSIQQRNTGYGFNQIETPDHQWLALVGLRYEKGENNPFSLGVKPQNTFKNWAHQLGLGYRPTGNHTLFFNYSESYLPIESVNPDGKTFDPESGSGYELGLRSAFLDGKLNTTLTAWQNTRSDVLEVDNARTYNNPANPNNQVYNRQGGLQRARGMDAEVSYSMSSAWQITSALSWIPYAKTEKNASNPLQVNRRMRYVPRWAGSVWAKYQPTSSWRIYGGTSFQSATFWDDTGTLGTYKFDAWASWDAGVGYTLRLGKRAVDIDLFGQNLTDNELTTVIHPLDRRRIFLKFAVGL